MIFNQEQYDGAIFLGANRDKGIWANQMQLVGNRSRVTRTGGRLNGASQHTLLTIALLSALRSISLKMASGLLSSRRDGRSKPVLLVRSINPTFLTALDAAIHSRQDGPALRTIKSLHQPLIKQLRRFRLVLDTEPANNAILATIDFVKRNILSPIDEGESPMLVPSVFNQLD